MPNQKIIEKEWNDFAKAVLPKDVSSIQYKEMRRAFYAGAWVILQTCKRVADEEMPDEAAVAIIDSMEKECVGFIVKVAALDEY